MMKYTIKYNEDTKRFKEITDNKKKCKHCGHTQLIGLKDRGICTWCKHYIYKDDKTEFMYKIKATK